MAGPNTPPVIDNESPPPGTVIESSVPVSFDVTDSSGILLTVLLAVYYPNEGRTELAYEGSRWLGPYALGSRRDPITNGFRFTTIRDGGWPSSPIVRVFAFDGVGTEQQA